MKLPSIDEDELSSLDETGKKDSRLKTALKRFDKNFLIAAGVAIIALALVLGYTITSAVLSADDQPTPSESSSAEPTAPESTAPTSAPTAEPESPLVQDGVDFADVKRSKDAVTISVKGTTLTSSQSGSPTLALSEDNKVESAATSCKVKDTLSFCLVATTQFGSQSFSYFYSRDVAHSKLLRDSKDVRQVDLEGADSAAFVTIDFANQGKRRVLAIAAQDSSGYLITLPEGSGTSTEDTLIAGITLK